MAPLYLSELNKIYEIVRKAFLYEKCHIGIAFARCHGPFLLKQKKNCGFEKIMKSDVLQKELGLNRTKNTLPPYI